MCFENVAAFLTSSLGGSVRVSGTFGGVSECEISWFAISVGECFGKLGEHSAAFASPTT